MEEHFREPDLSVESICKELHVSSSYFSKIFKQETETTFLNYLIRRRMEEAKMLLKMTDYKSQSSEQWSDTPNQITLAMYLKSTVVSLR